VLDSLFFYIFALLTLGGAILTVTRRSAVHSAIALIVSLLGVAGLYLLQRAEFLFAVQIVLYIGGIMVLFLFVIMLVNLDEAAKQAQFNRVWGLCLAILVAVGAELWWFFSRGSSMSMWSKPVASAAEIIRGPGNTERIADSLFSEYLLPFEVASMLLLVAVVGSVFMAKKERPQG
jgi:NADH-quinone oxidoreductase subunit J